jgi:hypothetical protein
MLELWPLEAVSTRDSLILAVEEGGWLVRLVREVCFDLELRLALAAVYFAPRLMLEMVLVL